MEKVGNAFRSRPFGKPCEQGVFELRVWTIWKLPDVISDGFGFRVCPSVVRAQSAVVTEVDATIAT